MGITMTSYLSFRFDAARHDFVGAVARLFNVQRLEELHEEHKQQFKVGADSCTSFHTRFYDKYRAGWPEMEVLYERFIREVLTILWEPPFLYQKFPTFRIHLRGNLAVGAFHNDAQFGHPEGEVNYIIPLTNSDGDASVWVESMPGRGDFEPMKLRVGRLIQFNGNLLTHGNKVNTTGQARVSMDFRILAREPEGDSVSLTRKTKFKVGEYYKRLEC